MKTALTTIFFIALILGYAESSYSQVACRKLFIENSRPFDHDLLQVKGYFVLGEFAHEGTFAEIAGREEVKKLIESSKSSTNRILGTVQIPESLGGGKLRLVTLELGNGNRAYNHQELVALLEVNPDLANRIGFFKVEGYENVVWTPDIVQLNYRLDLIAKEYGVDSALWGYQPAAGILAFKPYIELLAKGKFPFSTDADVNLSIHDVMHSVSFAALNSTPASRQVMEIAQKRNQSVLDIYSQLQSEIPGLANTFEQQATMLASDPMERTMLLTILMTGNFGYFSPSAARAEGRVSKLQNKEITFLRIKTLLKLYSQGAVNFKSIYDKLKSYPQNEVQKNSLKAMFQKEIDQSKFASDELLDKASKEILEYFFPSTLFSNQTSVKDSQNAAGHGLGGSVSFSFSLKEENLD